MKTMVAALAMLFVLLAGRSADDSSSAMLGASHAATLRTTQRGADTQRPIVRVAGYRLYAAPKRLEKQCRRAQAHVRFPVLCPTLFPHAKDGTVPKTYAQWGDYPKNVISTWLYAGGNYGGEADRVNWSYNNPNFFFHFFVMQGRLSVSDLELAGDRYPQKFVGRRTITGHRGRLYTQVPYHICGCTFSGHVTFIWRQFGAIYAASLHRWAAKPTPAILAMLDALVAHLRRV